jgi:preprotein translocase subunit SecB
MTQQEAKRSPFIFQDFLVIESSIKRLPIIKEDEFELEIIPEGVIHEGSKTFDLVLNVKVFEKNGRFEALVKGCGIFSFKDVTNLEDISDYFYVNAPAMIFPYIRSYIMALTSLSGLETITLPVVSMGHFKDELIKNTKQDPQHQVV